MLVSSGTLPCLDQHFGSATLSAWRCRVSADLCARSGFRSGLLLDIRGSHQLLISSHVRKRDKALLRGVMVGCLEWLSFEDDAW